jgi:hypothetical protein
LLALVSPAPPQLYLLLLAVTLGLHFVQKPRGVQVASAVFFGALMLFSLLTEVSSIQWTDPAPVDAYSVLAGQFEKGQLHMPVDPDPRLSQLSNPYSPDERKLVGIPYAWDHSLYQGHYYLYWGITPILTVMIPFHLLTGRWLSEVGQMALFGLLTFLLGYWLSLRLVRRFAGIEADPVESFLLAGVLAFCTEFTATMRQPAIYQVSIFACAAFTFAALLVLTQPPRQRWRIAVSGLLFGFAIGCRPTAIAALLFVPALIEGSGQWLRLAAGMAPMGVVIAAYNYLRFGNPLESGFFYQLGVTDMTHWRVSFKNELYAFGSYLFTPLLRLPRFPFLMPRVFGEGFLGFRHDYGFEAVCGVLASAPFLFLLPLLWKIRTVWRSRWFSLLIASGIAGLYLAGAAAVYRRYAVGFYPFLILAALIAFWLADRVQPAFWRRILVIVAVIASIHDGFYASVAVQSSKFPMHHPELYSQLRTLLGG